MARMNMEELAYWLINQDPSLKILIVESPRDAHFWSVATPETDRKDAIVIPITEIDMPGSEGGNRGRAMLVANELRERGLADRCLVFLDSDNDYILNIVREHPIRVTDFRDMECYAFDALKFADIIASSGREGVKATVCLQSILSIGKRIGIMHALNQKDQSELAITSTLHDHPSRYFTQAAGGIAFNETRFARAINGGNAAAADAFIAMVDEEEANFTGEPRLAVRGKDGVLILARFLNETFELCLALIHSFLLFHVAKEKNYPAIQAGDAFLRGT